MLPKKESAKPSRQRRIGMHSEKFYVVVLALLLVTIAWIPEGQRVSVVECFSLHPRRTVHGHCETRVASSLDAAKGKGAKSSKRGNVISVNRLAYRNYEILETFEAGVALTGTEVKAIRDGKLNLRDGYVRPTRNGRSCVLHNVHIGKHSMAGEYFQHEERRPRALLVHRHEARRMLQKTEATGMTIVPIKAYFSDSNQVKIEIALCRGKNVRDKRATIKERDAKREENRIIKTFRVPA
jgi:SsrA-binding protein